MNNNRSLEFFKLRRTKVHTGSNPAFRSHFSYVICPCCGEKVLSFPNDLFLYESVENKVSDKVSIHDRIEHQCK
jgi:hypothetical protein